MGVTHEELQELLKGYCKCAMKMYYPLGTDNRSDLIEKLSGYEKKIAKVESKGYICIKDRDSFSAKFLLGSDTVCEYSVSKSELQRYLINCILVSDFCSGFVNDISGKSIAVIRDEVLKAVDIQINAMSGSLELTSNGNEVKRDWISANVVQGGRVLRCLEGLVKCGAERISIGFVRIIGRRRYIVSYIGID